MRTIRTFSTLGSVILNGREIPVSRLRRNRADELLAGFTEIEPPSCRGRRGLSRHQRQRFAELRAMLATDNVEAEELDRKILMAKGRNSDRWLVANHEAGHACVALALGGTVDLLSSRCTPGSDRLGYCWFSCHDHRHLMIALLAGREASRKAGDEDWRFGGSADVALAVSYLREHHDVRGEAISHPVFAAAEKSARLLVDELWPAIEYVAARVAVGGSILGVVVRRELERQGVFDDD